MASLKTTMRRTRAWLGVFNNRIKYGSMSNENIFDRVYTRGQWGGADSTYFSGPGSHDDDLVGPYVTAVSSFIQALPDRVDAVDLGCGDFAVGSRLRALFGSYIACDVVSGVIEQNRRVYADLDVEFRVVDIARDALPAGDVVMLRQVFQHLSNAQILAVIPKLSAYRYAIITEHLPKGAWRPNRDVPTGPGVRAKIGSGVAVDQAPFGLSYVAKTELCRVDTERTDELVTTAYQLR